MSSRYYSPSGRFAPLAFSHALLVCAVAVPVSWVYAFFTVDGPLILRAVAALGFCAFLFVSCALMVKSGKIRSALVTSLLSTVIGVFAWYVQWAQWAAMGGAKLVALWPGVLHFALHPVQLFTVVLGVKGSNLSGIATGLGEAFLFIVVPGSIARVMARSPFCETSQSWIDEVKMARRFRPVDPADQAGFVAILEAEPHRLLELMGAPPAERSVYAQVSMYPCDGGAFVSISNVTETVKDGKMSAAARCFIDALRVPAEVASEIVAQCSADIVPEAGEDDAPPTPVELEAALAAMEDGDFSTALARALPFCDTGAPMLRNDALRMCALCCSRMNQWSEAAAHWQALFEHETSAHNALQVASSLAMAGQLAAAEQWITRTLNLNEQTGDLATVLIYTNFITALSNSGQMKAALPYLDWVRQLYQSLHITDATFLTLRGVPFFGAFLDKSAPIVDASMDAAQAQSWYSAMLPHLDQPGQQELGSWLALRQG